MHVIKFQNKYSAQHIEKGLPPLTRTFSSFVKHFSAAFEKIDLYTKHCTASTNKATLDMNS